MGIVEVGRTTVALAIFGCIGVGSALADPTGIWLDKDGDTLRIQHCGPALCGTIVNLRVRLDPQTGQPRTDKKNVDVSRRDRPLVGVQGLISMRPSGPGKWSGQLYNVEDGRTYAGNLIELGSGKIRIEGCVLGLCGGESLSRIAAASL
jgi:uncharacterized protein (DUF2147 family)